MKFEISGIVTASMQPDISPVSTKRVPTPPALRGVVLSSQTGYPVARVKVAVVGSTLGSTATIPLGEAITGVDGRFEIHFLSLPKARQALVVIDNSDEMHLAVKLATTEGKALHNTVRERQFRLGATLTVLATLPTRTLGREDWLALGRRLVEARIVQVHQLAQGLLQIGGVPSPAPDWSVDQCDAVLHELETEFLDRHAVLRTIAPVPSFAVLRAPSGLKNYRKIIEKSSTMPGVGEALAELQAKVAAFGSLLEVDWVMDLEEFQKGAVALALTKNQSAYEMGVSAAASSHPVVATDIYLVNYRNYLRTIFTGAPNSSGYDQYRQQLENRFKQNFTTTSTASEPLNGLLIPVVKAILTAPTGTGYGFNIAANALPAQGAKSTRAYLDDLIGLSNISRDEFQKRYRLDLGQPDSVLSSRVALNIHTLQRFYSDGFQSVADPFPIIPSNTLGRAPFYLTYDEWYGLNGPFYPENYYQIRRSFDVGLWDDELETVKSVAKASNADGRVKWFGALIEIQQVLAEAQKKVDQLLYTQAKELYLQAGQMAEEALFAGFHQIGSDWLLQPHTLAPSDVLALVTPALNDLLALAIKTPADLDQDSGWPSGCFMEHYRNIVWEHPSQPGSYWKFYDEHLTTQHPKHRLMLLHAYLYLIPTCLGDVCMAAGDFVGAETYYAQTTAFLVGRALLSDSPGYAKYAFIGATKGNIEGSYDIHANQSDPFPRGNLPYTAESATGATIEYAFTSVIGTGSFDEMAQLVVPGKTHPMEHKFFRLRHGGALLEWADSLYRTGDASSVARAREVYKAVLYAHGVDPEITPHWPGKPQPKYTNHTKNPATVSQIVRAQKGLSQIDNGLNYYGATEAYVPPVRYQILKDAADRFAAAARSAEQDFITSVAKIEDAVRDGILTANMLKKASLQATIAGEQIDIAQTGVSNALGQVDAVEKAIEDKKKELADHDDFGQQFLDFCSGFVGALTSLPFSSLPKAATAGLGDSVMAGFGLGEVSGSGWLGLGAAGAGVAAAGAFGLFVYAGVSGIMSVGDAQNRRADELSQLENTALPQAQQQLMLQQKQLHITQLQQQIALADAQLANDLIRFQATRTLTTEFWASIAQVMKRLLRRYLELGARYAWLAERALAYEQDRAVNIVRFDYFPSKTYNVTGPELLQLDLAELEASRLASLRQTVPVKLVYSLAGEFPFAFAKFKKTGRCEFWPSETRLQAGYPGIYGYRVRAVTLSLQSVGPRGGARGLLTNRGVSVITRRDGSSHLSVRTPDALPFSDFKIHDDGPLFGMIGETLLNFEGSGLESWWQLEFPRAANRQGFDDITDVLVTFDLTSSYAPELYATHIKKAPTQVQNFVMFSAYALAPQALGALQTQPGQIDIPFNLAATPWNPGETNRKITNVMVGIASPERPQVNAKIGAVQPAAVSANFTLHEGIAISNAAPFDQGNPPPPPAPLNVLVHLPVDQTLTLTIDTSAHPNVKFSQVVDVVLGIEYQADVA